MASCCTNCSLIRVKSVDIYSTHTSNALTLDPNVPPVVPVSPPANVSAGHTLIEKYDNGLAYWTFDGTNWVLDYIVVSDDIYHTQFDATGNTIDINTLPTAPINPPLNVEAGHTLHEKYDNGSVYWTYDGANWVLDYYIVNQDIYNTHYNAAGNLLDNVTNPTTPITPPTNVVAGHTLHENYDNGQVFWTYDGTNWVLDYVIRDGCCHYQNDETGNVIDENALPTAPLNPPLNPGINDTIIEKYDNGQVYWTYDGNTWVQDFYVISEDIYNTHYDGTGNLLDNLTLPTTPLNPPTNVIAGHTLHENYDNGQAFWTYDGTNWILDYVIRDGCCTTVNTETTLFDCANEPTAPVNPPVSPNSNDTYIEVYPRVTIYWTFDGTVWVKNATEYRTDDFNVSVVGNILDELIPPTTPITPGVTTDYINGDTLREEYDNGYAQWEYNGCVWVLDYYRVLKCCITIANEANYDCANPPLAPVTPPSSPNNGDIHYEYYSNNTRTLAAIVTWQYDGATWVLFNTQLFTQEFVHDYHDLPDIDIVGIANGTAHLTPLVPGVTTDYINSDTLTEEYDNGEIYWKYVDCIWVRQAIDVECDCCEMTDIVPQLTVSDPIICADTSVDFTETSLFISTIHEVCEWMSTTWDFQDGTPTVSGRNVSHTFTTVGLYAVEATITCTSGHSETQVIYVQVSDVTSEFQVTTNYLEATFDNVSNVNGCTPTYNWDFGDGTTSTLAEPGVHLYAASGTYNVTLTITCDTGCSDTFTLPVVVEEQQFLDAQFTIADNNICITDTTQLTDTSISTPNPVTSWLWEEGLTGFVWSTISTSQNPIFTPTGVGSWLIRLTVSDGVNTDSITKVISVSEVVASMTTSNPMPFNGEAIILNDTSTVEVCEVTSRTWTVSIDGGAATPFGTGSVTEVYTIPETGTTFDFTLTVTCDSGCTDTTTLQVTATPTFVLPCVDAECYISRVGAQNPTNHRLFGTGAQGYSPALISSTGQTFNVDGHPTATVLIKGTGLSSTAAFPSLSDAGLPSARITLRNTNAQAAQPYVLTYTFSEPVCGVVSYSINVFGAGTNPIGTMDTNVPVTVGPRSDGYTNITYTQTGNHYDIDYIGGTGAEAALIYFDNLTTISFGISAGLVALGVYISETCVIEETETNIAHCPVTNEFYTWNGTDWVLDGSITAVGEWLAVDCENLNI